MSKESNANGTGKSISFVFDPLTDVELNTSTVHPREEFCTGFTTLVSGKLEVKLSGQPDDTFINAFAGMPNMYDIELLKTGGAVQPTDVQLFWQS